MPPKRHRGLATLVVAAVVLGLLPRPAAGQTPVPSGSEQQQPIPSHDWRAPGYVAVVDGRLYDPECRPLRSAGSNVPNLMFRRGVRENLEWMRLHQFRWMRVIVTGHAQPIRHPDVAPGAVERRLEELLREVEAFNAAHDPSERIYVLVSLNDYYEPGVPGDRFAFDKPGWCQLRVLNAPWYRRGVPRYDFQDECDGGRLENAPNYEAHYKPWVQRLVSVGARSPAILGWQLGNEMKARHSILNGISEEEAYAWYLDWTIDMVDTIRAIDRAHLIFTGTQYMAELLDLPYRPEDATIQPDMRPTYEERFDRMLRACGAYCWNVWSLTNFDFRLYSVDDGMLLDRAGVAAVITEYGFTLGTREEELKRFGGDRRIALRDGLPQAWQDLQGNWHQRYWGALELIERGGVDGIAPWGSPNPDPGTEPGLDLDRLRGISEVPEGSDLWNIWREIGSRLENTNRAAGVSASCQAYVSG